MECMNNNKWRLVFIAFVSIIAFIGYRYSHVTMTNPVVATVDSSNSMAVVSKDDIYPMIREFIMNHPEVILESMEQMQKRQSEEITQQVEKNIKNNLSALEDTTNTPFAGNKNGDITVVMMYDYNCGYCKKANDIVNQLLDLDKDVKLIYKPIAVLGEASDYATRLMLSVYKTDSSKFKLVHDNLMSIQQLNKPDMKLIIEKNQFNFMNLEMKMDSKEVKDMQQDISNLAESIRLSGVPVFIINGKFYRGGMDLESFKNIIDSIRKNNPEN